MKEMIAALMLTLCVVIGMQLRYMPFAQSVTRAQRRNLSVGYILWTAVYFSVIFTESRAKGLEAVLNYMRYGGILSAAVLTAINVAVIRRWIRQQLFVLGIVLTCHYLMMSVPNFVITLISGLSPTGYIFLVIVVYLLLLILTYWPLHKLLHNSITVFLHSESGDFWHTIWFMPLAYFTAKYISLGGTHDSGSLIQLTSSVLSGVIMISLCINIASGHGRMCKNQKMERQLAEQKAHYAELKARIEDARKVKHDFKHHVAAIRHYMDTDNKEGLREYCDTLIQPVGGDGVIPYTGNSAADGVLYHYMHRARENGIHLSYGGVIRSPGIPDMDISVLLGNALDNALDGCMTVKENRSIKVIFQSEKQVLSILVRNCFDGKVETSSEGLLSRKRENSTGIGLASMQSICKKYGGMLETVWDDTYFTVTMILPIKEAN